MNDAGGGDSRVLLGKLDKIRSDFMTAEHKEQGNPS
jgi:hypothetical protein